VTFLSNSATFLLSAGHEFVEALIKEVIMGSWSLVIYQHLLLLRLINECGIEAKRLLKYYDRENKGK